MEILLFQMDRREQVRRLLLFLDQLPAYSYYRGLEAAGPGSASNLICCVLYTELNLLVLSFLVRVLNFFFFF